jgi:hypothetical protein
MNIDVKSVSQSGFGPGASSIATVEPSGSARLTVPTMSRPVVISAGTVLYPLVKLGSTSW